MKFTKIICTIGPASEKKETLTKMARAGMNVARLNFSHGTYAHHAKLIRAVRSVAKQTGQPIPILQDLQGPRIRIGDVKSDKGIVTEKGEGVVLVPQSAFHQRGIKQIPNGYPELAKDIRAGQRILIADGLIELKVTRVAGQDIHATVIVPGVIKTHKGINVPGASISAPALTKKDRKDIAFGVSHDVEYIALSFVKSGKDIQLLRRLLKTYGKAYPGAPSIKIIAKIERQEALDHIDGIIEAADGIMVARGDLGIEVQPQRVPLAQKNIILKCMKAHKPVIVATQMLESMTSSRRPTRAEVSDVANAVIDHTDAVMLSGESATGVYPFETVQLMAQTLHETERSRYDDYVCEHSVRGASWIELMAHAASILVLSKKIKAMVVNEDSPELISALVAHRCEVPLLVVTQDARVRSQLSLLRGVHAFRNEKEMVGYAKKQLRLKKGDPILEVEPFELEIEML